jgi:hypothetical protein
MAAEDGIRRLIGGVIFRRKKRMVMNKVAFLEDSEERIGFVV